ncbi:S1 RNA-binding domain-containing protein [Nocardia bovistercoris]|uniref:S1 RNA-binding domain-containing protein n=1 Tax=Nocardia bovistercoris TaxID=2785916 RepID=A0A931I8L6_9NOCA|nr:S1 RNA-binding domain-containing protein [Nocardia bovistercoris]MBH0776864.1 S1 RNA-binding domain-containing protein [Nocardia bovistercoris]
MSHTEFSIESWRRFVGAHAVGGVLDATIVEIVPFGAFLEVAPGVHGLWHRSEWREDALDPEVGAAMSVRILAIDDERHRVSLAAA